MSILKAFTPEQIAAAAEAGVRLLSSNVPVPASAMDAMILLRALLIGVSQGSILLADPPDCDKIPE